MPQAGTPSKVIAAMFALTATLMVALAGAFVALQSVFPWMTVANPAESTTATRPTVAVPVDVTAGSPTVAERVLTQVMAAGVPGSAIAGWSEVRGSGGVPGVSFGFGCDPTDGLAPVVAQDRAWVQTRAATDTSLTRAVGTLSVSARAYPAGAGAAAFEGLHQAVLRCSAASAYPASGLGVAALQVRTGSAAAVVWRRGDVLMVGAVTSGNGPGSTTAAMPVFVAFDRALNQALADTCANQDAEAADAARSPYLNRAAFYGHYQNVPVRRPRQSAVLTAEARTTSPVVPVPAPTLPLVPVADLPTPPQPAITQGPTALPAPVALPQPPQAPSKGQVRVVEVRQRVADPDGPGCGWAFTGQVPPAFDADEAQAAFAADARTARRNLTAAWNRWQEAKLVYYDAYADYQSAADRYRRYTRQVAQVRQAWAVVDTARATYYTARDAYLAAVEALAAWEATRAQAREDYRAAQRTCRRQPTPEPAPEAADPTPTPAPAPTPTTAPTPTSAPSSDPEPDPEPRRCPAPRPAILDQTPPTVPASPVPAPAAQLPTPKQEPGRTPTQNQGRAGR